MSSSSNANPAVSFDKRQFYQLMINQLVADGYVTAASALADSTLMKPVTSSDPNRLFKLAQIGIINEDKYSEQDFLTTNMMDSTFDGTKVVGMDLEAETAQGQPLVKRPYPNYQTKFVTTHKNAVRAAKFSQDGKLLATGSLDTSLKLLDVDKMKTYNLHKGEGDEFAKPVIRTFYDHTGPINDMDFHPIAPVLASCSKDLTIRFYDTTSTNNKRAFKTLTDTHNIRSMEFHPSGDFLLTGTDHPIIRLWDVNTGQCYSTPKTQDHHQSSINQVRWTAHGGMFASAGKDGAIKLWDTTSMKLINTFAKPHSGYEVTCVQFTRNQKYLLSGGKDGAIRLWDVGSGKQLLQILTGAPWKHRLQAVFNYNEDYIIGSEETPSGQPGQTNSSTQHGVGVVYCSRTGEALQRLTGHTNLVCWVATSPVDNSAISCSWDHRARFWCAE